MKKHCDHGCCEKKGGKGRKLWEEAPQNGVKKKVVEMGNIMKGGSGGGGNSPFSRGIHTENGRKQPICLIREGEDPRPNREHSNTTEEDYPRCEGGGGARKSLAAGKEFVTCSGGD